ncbi:hypothetical protein PQR70_14500 [Paraburkholderia madseniana]|uniref:hypothetical protein n=1 Tax=Paraburkholderia madseniana TaxID=2599607 RepID=UPI0038BD83BE
MSRRVQPVQDQKMKRRRAVIVGSSADTVEKVVARRPNTRSEKFDLSDRPTNRSRASVKGKTTHENRVRTTVTDFFNSIRQTTDSHEGYLRGRSGSSPVFGRTAAPVFANTDRGARRADWLITAAEIRKSLVKRLVRFAEPIQLCVLYIGNATTDQATAKALDCQRDADIDS